MNTADHLATIIEELKKTPSRISDEEAEKLVDEIMDAGKIFVAGAGRSGLIGKSFVMRLMHMGIEAYVVGETVTGTFEENDLLIIGTGSGETKTLVPVAQKAKDIGGKVAAVTISPASTIGELADIIVQLPGVTKDKSEGTIQTVQPMGTLFEQTMLLFYDAIILRYMEKKELDSDKMYGKHANLE